MKTEEEIIDILSEIADWYECKSPLMSKNIKERIAKLKIKEHNCQEEECKEYQ